MVEDTSNNLYVAGCLSGVLRSTDNGSQWIQVLDNADVHGIAILPSQEIIAGCSIRPPQEAFRSTDYGDSWQEYSWGFTSLICNSTGLLFAVAGSKSMWTLIGSNYIFRSINNGATWDSVYNCIWDSVYDNRIYDIVTDNNDQVFAIGSPGIVTSTDNGNSWDTLNAGLTTNDVSAIAKNSEGEIFVGTPGGVYICVKKTPTGVINNKEILPNNFMLSQNYPNPFNPTTTIKYQIPELSFVKIKVYDVLGNEISTLLNEEKHTGTYELTWNAEQLPSGVYFYRLQAGDFVQTRKMVLLK